MPSGCDFFSKDSLLFLKNEYPMDAINEPIIMPITANPSNPQVETSPIGNNT